MKSHENRATKRARLKTRGQDFSGHLTSVPKDQEFPSEAVQKNTIRKEKRLRMLRELISFLTIPYRKRQLIMLSIAEWFFLPLSVFAIILSIPMLYILNKIDSLAGYDGSDDEEAVIIFTMTIGMMCYGYLTLALPRWYFTGKHPFDDDWKVINIFITSLLSCFYFLFLGWCSTGFQVEARTSPWKFPSTAVFDWFNKVIRKKK